MTRRAPSRNIFSVRGRPRKFLEPFRGVTGGSLTINPLVCVDRPEAQACKCHFGERNKPIDAFSFFRLALLGLMRSCFSEAGSSLINEKWPRRQEFILFCRVGGWYWW